MHEASEQADTRLSELLYLLLYSYLTTYGNEYYKAITS